MPIRKLRKSYRNVTGIASASKAIGTAQFASILERDFLRVLEFSPDVLKFEVEPVTITWFDTEGKKRRYTPDVWVSFKDETHPRPWLCEVKYRADLKENWHELRPKFHQAIRYANQQGWRFRLITEVEIRTPLLKAAKFLLPFRRITFPADKPLQILEVISRLQTTTLDELLQYISPEHTVQAEWLPVIWHLISLFKIGADLEVLPSPTARIWSLQ